MTNLEIMEKAVECTMTMYSNKYSGLVTTGSISSEKLEMESIKYSGDVLFKVLNSTPGVYSAYTRRENLRQEMVELSFDSIKTELLKNVVSVAMYNRLNNTRASNQIGNCFSDNLTDEEIAVILLNNLIDYGVERGFELLNDPMILASVCRVFAYSKTKQRKAAFEEISNNNQVARYVNNEIDIYYARFCDRKKQDTTVLGA